MASLDRIATRLGVDLMAVQAQLYDATAIADAMGRAPWQRGLVSIDPARPALVSGVTPETVGAVDRFLVDGCGTATTCHVLDADIDGEPATSVSLGQLRSFIVGDTEAMVWVEAGDAVTSGRSPETLARIVAQLRAPGGCPWDREQTARSLRHAITDESYEIVDAIYAADDANLAEELGDVLMTVALQAQIAEDEGRFTLTDVYETVNAKLVRRHPHVFGDTLVSGTEDIVANWNRIKADEKGQAGTATADPADPVARFPLSMPTTVVIERLLASGRLNIGGGGILHDDPERSNEHDRQMVDHFVLWYASRRSLGYDAEAEMRQALRRFFPPGGESRSNAE